jgi:hypothetical protein
MNLVMLPSLPLSAPFCSLLSHLTAIAVDALLPSPSSTLFGWLPNSSTSSSKSSHVSVLQSWPPLLQADIANLHIAASPHPMAHW